MDVEWGYNDDNGPSTWSLIFPQAAGSRQSPVDIVTSLATSDDNLRNAPLKWYYGDDGTLRITNSGYGWRVDVTGKTSGLTGGPLTDEYKLEQFHCHWGPDNYEGSEHTVNGKTYAGELHFVHWHREKYPCFNQALASDDGLAVVAVLLEIGPEDHPEFEKIVYEIPNIMYKRQCTNITNNIKITNFFPDEKSYWTYLGSLTTPPCSESVVWIVFKQPIQVSVKQLEAFRSLRSCEEEKIEILPSNGKLLRNYRPPLPLGNRVLREYSS